MIGRPPRSTFFPSPTLFRSGPPGRGMDRRGPARSGRVGDGLAPVRSGLRQPRLHAGAHVRGVLDLLRRQVPGPRTKRRTPSARLTALLAAGRSRGCVWREIWLGARQLVRAKWDARRPIAPTARLGGTSVVTGG